MTGWGVYGLALAQGLIAAGGLPLLLKAPAALDARSAEAAWLAPHLAEPAVMLERVRAHGSPLHLPMPIVKTLTSSLEAMHAGRHFSGSFEVGVTFFEDTRLRPEAVERGRRYDLLVAGSSWNHALLQAAGLDQARRVLQGVDGQRFSPSLRRPDPSRFTVWSAGKLEHRKGQDLVLAAFRRFRVRHPEARLVTAWQSAWPAGAQGVAQSRHVLGSPALQDGRLDIVGWAHKNGLPVGSVVDVGLLPHHRMPEAMAGAHVAVFASRYESGTNLPAMEAMSMGLPVVLSANTGHLDLIDDLSEPGRCYPLTRQGRVEAVPAGWGSEGWGESEVDELDHALERVYTDRAEAERRGAAAARFMEGLRWDRQVAEFLALLPTDGAPGAAG